MSADRERIAELLEDDARSFRSIARELNVSDWLVRKTARELYNDPRPMRQRHSRPSEPSPEDDSSLASWLVFGGVIGFFALAIWAALRSVPSSYSRDYYTETSIPIQTIERRHDETQFPE
jgi:hypothetical protein